MNNDMIINRIANATGKSRKEVIQALKQMSANPYIKKQLRNSNRKYK